MSEQTAAEPQDQGTDGAPITESQTPDLNAVMERMTELSSKFDAFQPPPPPQQGIADQVTQPQFDPYAGQAEDDEPDDPYGEPDQQAQVQALEQFVNQRAEQVADRMFRPFLEQQRMDHIRTQAVELERKYPDLAKPEHAGPIVQEAQKYAQSFAQRNNLPPEIAARIAQDPELIENLYLAQRARQQAQQETPADALSNVQLEGAAAQSQQPEMDDFDRMAASRPNGGGFKWS